MSLADLSDDELRALYQRSDASRLMPALIAQESGGRAGVKGPQTQYGRAVGLTQLLPATAREMATKLGVDWRPDLLEGDDQESADYQRRLGQAYLQQGLDETGNDRDALHYYHGGPDRGLWGPKTRAYADAVLARSDGGEAEADLSGMSDDDLIAAYKSKRETADKAASASEAVTAQAPPPVRGASAIPMKKASEPAQGLAAAWEGFAEPFSEAWSNLEDRYRRKVEDAQSMPRSLGEFVDRAASDLGGDLSTVGDVLNLAGAPLKAAARPVARWAAENLPAPGKAPELIFDDGIPRLTAPRDMTKAESGEFFENAILDATNAAMPTKRVSIPKKAPVPSLDDLKAASDAAWARVDASGFRFPKADLKAAADDIVNMVKTAGAELYPDASKIAARVQSLAKTGDLTPAQANRLRSQVGEKLLQPGSTEASLGGQIKARIDSLIDMANDPNLAAARELYTRLTKAKEVTGRIEAADLRAASTYAGGNKANATRQNLRPLIDPKSPQRIRNLTPDEEKALGQVVRGTPGANTARVTGKLLDPRGLLGAAVQGALGIPTGGQSLLAAVPGMAASELSNVLTNRAAQRLLDLIAVGGRKVDLRGVPLKSLAVPALGVLEALQLPDQLRDGVPMLPPKRTSAAPAQPAKRR